MGAPSINVSAICYELGEVELSYESIPGFYEQAKSFGMPLDADLWGWGRYHCTSRDASDLVSSCAHATLTQAKISAAEIDAVIICAAIFPNGIEDQKKFTDQLVDQLSLSSDVPIFGLTLNRCATLLNGMQLAYGLVSSTNYNNVLLVGVDKVASEKSRFTRFGIFSDAVVSCLVSSSSCNECYNICDFVFMSEVERDLGLVNIGGQLAAKANDKLWEKHDRSELSHVFHDNLFLPIVTLREQMAGFSLNQLFLSNIDRVGHCFTCDPLINLVDFESKSPIVANTKFLLACSVPGIRIQVLLKKLTASC